LATAAARIVQELNSATYLEQQNELAEMFNNHPTEEIPSMDKRSFIPTKLV